MTDIEFEHLQRLREEQAPRPFVQIPLYIEEYPAEYNEEGHPVSIEIKYYDPV